MEDEIFEKINFSFSTADADIISIEYKENLELIIKDWQENKIKIIFENVLTFNYQFIDSNHYRNDEVYIVNDSKWLKKQLKLFYENYYDEKLYKMKHYKLCFNNYDMELNVICSDIINHHIKDENK
jgi:hypothetical protein